MWFWEECATFTPKTLMFWVYRDDEVRVWDGQFRSCDELVPPLTKIGFRRQYRRMNSSRCLDVCTGNYHKGFVDLHEFLAGLTSCKEENLTKYSPVHNMCQRSFAQPSWCQKHLNFHAPRRWCRTGSGQELLPDSKGRELQKQNGFWFAWGGPLWFQLASPLKVGKVLKCSRLCFYFV